MAAGRAKSQAAYLGLTGLGWIAEYNEDIAEAEDMHQKALGAAVESWGLGGVDTVRTANKLENFLRVQGKDREAEVVKVLYRLGDEFE